MNHNVSLNGIWRFAFDRENEGIDQQWMIEENQPYLENKIRITVPGVWKTAQVSILNQNISPIGWYWKKFAIEPLPSRTYYLKTPGIHQKLDVYIDGQDVGQFSAGGIPTKIDVSPYLKSGDHFIALRVEVVDNPKTHILPKYPIEYGGIPYNIEISSEPLILLKEKSMRTILKRDMGSNEVKYAELEFTLYFENKTKNEFNGIARVSISRDFLVVNDKTQRINILANNTRMIRLVLPIDGDNLDLWSIDIPNTYTLQVDVFEGDIVDANKRVSLYSTIIGVYEVKWESSQIFTLNSKQYESKIKIFDLSADDIDPFRGTINLNQSLVEIKKNGFNVIRARHFIFSEIVFELATRLGLLVLADLPLLKFSMRELEDVIGPYIFAINFYPSLIGYVSPRYEDLSGSWEQILIDLRTIVKKVDITSVFL